ncbi:hypothetical protein CEXT_550951 [Caerostris extrusa]|uniref:Uncharacterized protein n=1 Tax=Caerostris extrusa TaxID=172846 RepID=A0AAV4U5T8_CAEEX|nr:hypothetical protein CEXT_550951 [Caerostris extrusa]
MVLDCSARPQLMVVGLKTLQIGKRIEGEKKEENREGIKTDIDSPRSIISSQQSEDTPKILIKPGNATQVIGHLSFNAISRREADPLETKALSLSEGYKRWRSIEPFVTQIGKGLKEKENRENKNAIDSSRASFEASSQDDTSEILIKPDNATRVIGNLSFNTISRREADPLETKAPSHCLRDTDGGPF